MIDKSMKGEGCPVLFQYVAREECQKKPFVILDDDWLTYGALQEVMARTARLFQESEIGMGDRIVICSKYEIEAIALYASALRVGVTAVLIDPHSALPEARTLVKAAQAKGLFADKEILEAAPFINDLLTGGSIFEVLPAGPYAAWDSFAKAVEGAATHGTSYPAVLERYRGLPSATARAGRLVGAAPRHPEVHLLAGANVTHQVNAKGADAEARRRGPLDREKRGPVTFGVWCLQYAAQTCSQRSLTLSPGSPAIWRNSPP